MKLTQDIYPVFEANQVLSDLHLNEIVNFLDEQERLTRANLIGIGIVSFIDSISAIAAGQVAGAAKKVEQTMANTLTVIIAFLAKFAGLGNIPEKLVGIIKKIRQPIDKGLDKIVAWLGNLLKKAAGAVLQAGVPQDPNERLKLGMGAAVGAVNRFAGRRVGVVVLRPLLSAIKMRYGFSELRIGAHQNEKCGIRGRVNPYDTKIAEALLEFTGTLGPEQRAAIRSLMGKDLSSDTVLYGAWTSTFKAQQQQQIFIQATLEQKKERARYFFGLHRNRFWNAVRGGAGKAIFTAAGYEFTGRGTPKIKLPGGVVAGIDVDHKIQLSDQPHLALDVNNLRLAHPADNQTIIRLLNQRDPFQNPPADWVPM